MTLVLAGSPARAENDHELVFGMSAAFTGANSELGIEFYRGLTAYLDYFNAAGGADGWTIKVKLANDGYNPAPCFQNTVNFVVKDHVFALTSYVGSPTTMSILPLLQKFEDNHLFLLFPFSGVQPLRTEPFNRYVFNLRASYFDETKVLVDHLVSIGRRRIAVFYQSDTYGRTGWDGVCRALNRHGLTLAGEAAYYRGAKFEQDFSAEVASLVKKDPDSIIVVGTYSSQAAFVRDARNVGCNVPIAGLSFSDSDKMLDLLKVEGQRTGKDYTKDLIHSQVVPSYEDVSLPGVRFYRKVMDAYEGEALALEQVRTPRRFSFVSFEGFLNGMLLGEMVKRMSDNPTRERIPAIMESIKDLDLGIGVNVHFGPGRHQGLDCIYLTTVQDGKFRAIDNWDRWRK